MLSRKVRWRSTAIGLGLATALSVSGVRAAFDVEIVQPAESGIGSQTVLSYDSAGNPTFAYGGSLGIHLASKNGGSWSVETIDTRFLARLDHDYDSSGTAAVSYTASQAGFSIFYAEKISGSWQIKQIANHVSSNVNSLAFDGGNVPAVVYDKSNKLFFTRRPGSSWVNEVVAFPVNTFAAALAYDGGGNPNVAFIDDQRSNDGLAYLNLATKSGSTWSIETITSTPELLRYPSLVFDPTNGEATILYSLPSLCLTRLARKTGGSWQIEDVVSASHGTFAFDSTGTPHVGYRICGDANQLFVAHKNIVGSWISELVDSNTFISSLSTPSLGIDGADNPSVSYGQREGIGAPRELRFAGIAAGCGSDAECDDGNECTEPDICVASSCENTVLADNTSCSGGAGVCCGGSCSSPCNFDIDCDDGDICTDDSCVGTPGTCSASCDNVFDVTNDPSCDACIPTHNKEKGPRCSDGIDNDCDGLIDGDDPDC